ncbi:Metal-dependent hydrolases of the beta-lactamase superfamily III [Methanocella conradii HZ254]|uniref:Metal-dependent hydrolases of the beta-lactamase superfamily III n=1 Tax=Methanocella conradii (strain DSM 24694 / JCM 17849 / CGMCC 1.5162 / HZ254) TaxID=1041930 RepID=H8I9E0_METCZ|nr:MBL fold metallo-hydrolase [Methanocella conradii]AFC99558.1 Metal-dependent hydrolases of the beta-lactamase superfamily III [Methanocella conradii HZ254]
MSEIIFLGTAGGRMVVASQIRKSGGMWLELNGKNILLDPGPGCLLRCAELGLRPSRLDCIVLSHRHIDHSNDVNIMAEAMSGGGFKPKGILIAPMDCLEGDDPVVLKYVRTYIKNNVFVLKDGFKHGLDGVTIECALRLMHSNVECYGIKFHFEGRTLGYVADTKYFEGIGEAMKGCEGLILNMVRVTHDERFQHLIPQDVESILKVARPRLAILSHFGMQVVKAGPKDMASRVEKLTGVRTIAAEDGMRLKLDRREEKATTLGEFIGK